MNNQEKQLRENVDRLIESAEQQGGGIQTHIVMIESEKGSHIAASISPHSFGFLLAQYLSNNPKFVGPALAAVMTSKL